MRRLRKITTTLAVTLLLQSFAAGGAFAASSGAEVKIAAASAPEVEALYPADDAKSAPVSGKLLIRFADDIIKGSGNITIKDAKTFDTVATYSVTDNTNVQITQSCNVLIAAPTSSDYKSGGDYYVQVDAGAFTSKSGEPFAGITDTQTWNYHTSSKDSAKPSIISYTPGKNANVADLGSDLILKFNEPVIPGGGNVIIKDLSAGSPLATIPANSNDVSGVGTDTITISHKSFKPNMVYAVQIDDTAFTDMSGNAYKGIPTTDITTWRFTTTTDTTPPELVDTNPASGANYIALSNAVLKMTFSEPVSIVAGAQAEAVPKTGSTGAVPLAIGPDDSSDPDPRVLTLTPTTPLTKALTYVVHVPADAITDAAGNYFPGILNDYRWTFQTIGSDTTAPSLSTATMDGSVIVLTYNELLDENSVPYASNYYVTVNDIPRQVSGITVSGAQVKLTLQSGVAVGQTVKLSYTVGDRPLQDNSGNKAAAFSNRAVSNTTSTTLPKPTGGSVSGSTLTLTFNKSLQSVSSNAISQFTVKVNGSARSVYSLSVSGTSVIMQLSSGIANGQSVSVTYTPGSYPLLDTSGNSVAAFSNYYVQNASDTTPPILSSATASGVKVTLYYDEGLDPSSVPLKSSFSVLVNGTAYTVTGVSVTNNKVELTLGQSLSSGKIVLVTYIQGYPPIADLAGNPASTISNYQIVSDVSGKASLSSATVSGSTLTLNYSSALNEDSVPYTQQFVVKADGIYISVNSVTVSGSKVTLALASAVKQNQKVTLTYYNSGTPLQDSLEQTLDSLDEITVANQSPAVDNLPDSTDTNDNGGLTLAYSSATTVVAATPSGQSAKRYMIDGDKFVQAFATLKTNSATLNNMEITFTVPSTEPAGMVGIPISSLTRAASLFSNGVFRLEYGGMSFSLPLTAINYGQELSILGGDTSSAQLYMTIEKVSDSALIAAANAKGAQFMASPANFTVSISSGGREREVKNFTSYVTRSFDLNAGSVSPSEVSVIRYDSGFGDISYVPTTTETSGSTMSVHFMRKSSSVYAVVRKNVQVYSDMTGHWAKNDVSALATKFIVDGPTSATFAPDKNITREEFATFLARGLGLNGDSSSAARYSDVALSGSAAAYIGAVSQVGIVQGDANGRFNPKAPITREEMATMMLRAMVYAGLQPTATNSALAAYTDKGKVSSWASAAVSANIQAGIMNGVSPTLFKPKDYASRAQAAVMIKRFLEYVDLFEN